MILDIKSKLEEKGISRYELAKRIGVTYPTIDAIYKSKATSIKLENLEAICRELNCTPNDIIVKENVALKNGLENFEKLVHGGVVKIKVKELPEQHETHSDMRRHHNPNLNAKREQALKRKSSTLHQKKNLKKQNE